MPGTVVEPGRLIEVEVDQILVVVGLAGSLRFDPTGMLSQITALPMQIYSLTSRSQEEFQHAASAAIIVLLVLILGLNGLAIFIRNKFQRTW